MPFRDSFVGWAARIARRGTVSGLQMAPHHLLGIPGELRNQIYECLIVFPDPVSIYRGPDGDESPEPSSLCSVLALFLTCKQVYSEARSIFYSHNKFVLPSATSSAPHQVQANFLMRWFLGPIGPRNAASLLHLRVPFLLDPSTDILSCLRNRPQLEEDSWSQTLIPYLQGHCPHLETIELDMRWNNRWLYHLSFSPHSLRSVFGWLDDALRIAFPSLKHITLCITGGPGPEWAFHYPNIPPPGMLPPAEWKRLSVVLSRLGWTIALEGDGQDRPVISPSHSSWVALWYPKKPADIKALLYPTPHVSRTRDPSQWHRYPLTAAARYRVGLVTALLRSPSQAVKNWKLHEERRQWRAWRRSVCGAARAYQETTLGPEYRPWVDQ
ncbi:F-box domain-containing protein [Madurella fahalii]|uniref:F-box domain-containing protein n=1 Tax=Madurella fahalii TaxID=1157608 RepID=A0ABQ0GTI7_9PEZI